MRGFRVVVVADANRSCLTPGRGAKRAFYAGAGWPEEPAGFCLSAEERERIERRLRRKGMLVRGAA